MISRVHLVKVGDKVGNSEAALLQKLDIRPFEYGLVLKAVYDAGEVFEAAVLDITDDVIVSKITAAAGLISSVCLEIGYPTSASLVHTINNAFKNCVSIALGSDFSFARADEFADFLANPGNFVTAAP